MKEYYIKLKYAYTNTVLIFAESQEEAIKKAVEAETDDGNYNSDDVLVDWEIIKEKKL